jgi:hypothetical protein
VVLKRVYVYNVRLEVTNCRSDPRYGKRVDHLEKGLGHEAFATIGQVVGGALRGRSGATGKQPYLIASRAEAFANPTDIRFNPARLWHPVGDQ